ncbi:MAG: hypothetical protein NTZ84_00475 [Candidatus Nealsonbacteria bacterium]|nr:hypothetical protein [Candidatus Nealsonbacteria bacterium]
MIMEESDPRSERNIFAYDFKEFLTEKEAIEHAGKINRWKMPAGQKKIFETSREVFYPEILHIKKFILAFDFDECEGDLREAVETAKKSRSFIEGQTKIFKIEKEILWPGADIEASERTGKKITV